MAESNFRAPNSNDLLQFILEEGDNYTAVTPNGDLSFRSYAPLRGPIFVVNDDGSLEFLLEYRHAADRDDLPGRGLVRIPWSMFIDRCVAARAYVFDGNDFCTPAKVRKTRMPLPGTSFERTRKVVGSRDRYVKAEASWWRDISVVPGMGNVEHEFKTMIKSLDSERNKRISIGSNKRKGSQR